MTILLPLTTLNIKHLVISNKLTIVENTIKQKGLLIVEHQDIADFWLTAGPKKWWMKDDVFDSEIAAKFSTTHRAAANGELDHWINEPDSALALILVLDQFSRNLFRNDTRAFAQDAACLTIVKTVMFKGFDRSMNPEIGPFCYLPLMHSETIEDQQSCLQEMRRIDQKDYIKAAQQHLDIIGKFGRFPHRNSVLGRKTTVAEQAYLDSGGFSG
ncbi:MAG: DUF924 family protein [Rhizobiaceae bacterium]